MHDRGVHAEFNGLLIVGGAEALQRGEREAGEPEAERAPGQWQVETQESQR